MTLQTTGAISLSNIQTEFGGSNPISLNEYYAGGGYVPAGTSGVPSSGTISINQFYGKSNVFNFNPTISSSTYNYNLKSAAIAAGWNQTTPLIANVTVAAGVVIGSTSTAAAFDTSSGYPSGSSLALTIQSGAYISGKGGNGANYGPNNGAPGGLALWAQVGIKITNNGTIQGGGGGGGAGQSPWGGGGGGGGQVGGTGGIGGGYDDGQGPNGRPGTLTAGGIGGFYYGGAGGNPGQNGSNSPTTGVGYGGAAGACTSGNANITWLATGTRLGALG